ncbi:hypothetical protein DDZ14_12800 [Maritimibacter sp. 55A14]|uniref:serine/threonine-protein kinase n=1 Tax=Maritimibacter sp. 55A14 TaxID=2174844 RepID=UPI000D60C3CB|nr:serine/threonine-protein kinase [Maritimibacter sp. 55A14]PWE31388.1 hypothetical protein DDZ14_12800 [Maritimibacter sp. 55A14]
MAPQEQPETSELDGPLDELQPGTTLLHGQYTITRFLNNGGFGITYLAKDSLDRDVVIKECFADAFCRRTNTIVSARSRAHQSSLKSIIRHFIQEARSLSKLQHPNIVGVHQVFEDNDTAYMAIDFVDGKDLLDIVDDAKTKLTADQIVGITRKLLSAIGYVHQHGMLHRDISPDNILLNKEGEPILIDFGAAREHVGETGRKHSALRVVKDGYSPQEFYIAGSEQGPWSDLYALAASLYHGIKGEAPINGQARLAAIAEQRPDPYVPLAGAVDGYPAGFLEAIDKAMSTKPSARFQNAAEWIEMLDNPAAVSEAADANVKETLSRLLESGDLLGPEQDEAPARAAGITDRFGALADPAGRPQAAQASRGRGMIVTVSVLALLAALGAAGYTFLRPGTPPQSQVAAVSDTAPIVQDEIAGTPVPAPAPVDDGPVAQAPWQPEVADSQTGSGFAAAELAEPAANHSTVALAEPADAEAVPVSEPAAEDMASDASAPDQAAPAETDIEVALAEHPDAMDAADGAAADAPITAATDEPAMVPEAETALLTVETGGSETVAQAESATAPEEIAEPEAAGEPESVEPETVVEPESLSESEIAAEPVIAAEPETAEPESAAEPEPVVAAAAPAEPAPLASTGASLPVAQQQVTFELWDVAFPFGFIQNTVRNAEVAVITDVSDAADLGVVGTWVREGVEIYTVNDQPLSKAVPFASQILNAMVVDPDGYTRAVVRYKNAENNRFERALLAIPVVRRFGLADGSEIEARFVDDAWRLTVAQVGRQPEDGLQVGDVLVADVTTGRAFDTLDGVSAVLQRLVAEDSTSTGFRVLRDGAEMQVSYELARQW